ncbi:MAG TPA: SpoIIE family protein phosphatase [Pyrinomonadaceae bacterium]
MSRDIQSGSDGILSRPRAWLRRVMPRVAVAAAALLFVWLLVHNTALYNANPLAGLYGLLTFLAVSAASTYYGIKSFVWLKRRLLWRVRRRLIVTYIFIGLTPIILLSTLALLFAVSVYVADQPRVVTMRLEEMRREVLLNAGTLRDGFARLPQNAGDRQVQEWLDAQTSQLQASLPGARVALWRGTGAATETLGQDGNAQLVSDPGGENTRNAGSDTTPVGEPLPAWLRGRQEWSGLAFVDPPENSTELYSHASVRALARGQANGQAVAVLLVVPVSRALVERLREVTGVKIHPYLLNSKKSIVLENNGGRNRRSRPARGQGDEDPDFEFKVGRQVDDKGRVVVDLKRDQFGDPMGGALGPVMQNMTDWASGKEARNKLLFMFSWSLAEAGKQILAGSQFGQLLKWALIVIGVFFLILELLAVLSAAWMTRAVTGTVHKLYRATEFIKRGDFSHRVVVRSHDQLGELAGAFNDMSANIETLLHERVEHERLEREVEIAAEVQAQLFPRSVPALAGVEIAAECRAARGVAGDYYDYVEVAPGVIALALGDVSGKGISASLVMSNLQAALRAQAAITSERLSMAERAVAASADAAGAGKLLARVVADADLDGAVSRMTTNINLQLCQSTDSNRFATLFLALYEDRTGELRYTNAGHNAPVLMRADGSYERLTDGGMMTGAFDWSSYEEASTVIGPGDVLLIFSDGISEAARVTGEEFGEERIIQLLAEHRSLSSQEVLRAIFAEVESWSGTQERGDDQTLVIIKSTA